nr:hypothetical protein [Micromonospora sp. Llam0]
MTEDGGLALDGWGSEDVSGLDCESGGFRELRDERDEHERVAARVKETGVVIERVVTKRISPDGTDKMDEFGWNRGLFISMRRIH